MAKEEEELPPSIRVPIILGKDSPLSYYKIPVPVKKPDNGNRAKLLLLVTIGTACVGLVAVGAWLGSSNTTAFAVETNTSKPVTTTDVPTVGFTWAPNKQPDGDGSPPSSNSPSASTSKPTTLPDPDGSTPTSNPASTSSSDGPTSEPSKDPGGDGKQPSVAPTLPESNAPSKDPGVDGPAPTSNPGRTTEPTISPSMTSGSPSRDPGGDGRPTNSPSLVSSSSPSMDPGVDGPTPTISPAASISPSKDPGGDGKQPTLVPTVASVPSSAPIGTQPSAPTAQPTGTFQPSSDPTDTPTSAPTSQPSAQPTASPTPIPTSQPSSEPTDIPTAVPTSQPSAEPTNVPTPIPTCTPSGEELLLDFANADFVINNLGGYCVTCPEGSGPVLLLENIATTSSGVTIHLMVENVSSYTPHRKEETEIRGDFLKINMYGNSSVELLFSFFTYGAQGAKMPFVFPEAEITVYDIDHGGARPCEILDPDTCFCEGSKRHREALTVSDIPEIFITEQSTLCRIEKGNSTQFFSTAYGGGSAVPNPMDANALTPFDLSVSLGLRYIMMSQFQLKYHSFNSRGFSNFLVAGKSNIFPCRT